METYIYFVDKGSNNTIIPLGKGKISITKLVDL